MNIAPAVTAGPESAQVGFNLSCLISQVQVTLAITLAYLQHSKLTKPAALS